MSEGFLVTYVIGALVYFFYALIEEKPIVLLLVWPLAVAKIAWKELKKI